MADLYMLFIQLIANYVQLSSNEAEGFIEFGLNDIIVVL